MIKTIVPRLAEVGKIKIGKKGAVRKTQQGKEFRLPQKDDHFTITGLSRDKNDDFVPDLKIMEMVGSATNQRPDHLTEIPVRLLYDDIELNFPTRLACFNGTSCWCSGDGEKAERVKDIKTGEMVSVECPCERQNPGYKGRDKCKPTGVLSVVIDGIPIVGGVWKFRTTSYNSVVNIISSLTFIKSLTKGVLAGLPLYMVVSPKTANVEGVGNTTIFMVRLEYRGTTQSLVEIGYSEAERRAVAQIKMDSIEDSARLLVHQPMNPDEERDISEEFYPENQDLEETDEKGEKRKASKGEGSFLDAGKSDGSNQDDVIEGELEEVVEHEKDAETILENSEKEVKTDEPKKSGKAPRLF